MVNKNRQIILKQLEQRDSWVSGEELSKLLSISRVAIWKHIKVLIEEGYPINSGSKGYLLPSRHNILSPLTFTQDSQFIYFPELSSTMDEARQQLEINIHTKPFFIIADRQTQGIGRQKTWQSPQGGFYLSIGIPFESPQYIQIVDEWMQKTLKALIESLEELGLKDLTIQLPGSIFWKGTKVAGVLEEYLVRGSGLKWLAIGIGLKLFDKELAISNELTNLPPREVLAQTLKSKILNI